jgi:hypothetical protein
MVHERQANGRTLSKTSVLCIDKRNGRVCLDEDIPTSTNSFRLVGDPEKKTVEVQLQKNTYRLTFTDKPLPPEPDPADAPDEEAAGAEKGSKTTRAVWKALQKAIVTTPPKPREASEERAPAVSDVTVPGRLPIAKPDH